MTWLICLLTKLALNKTHNTAFIFIPRPTIVAGCYGFTLDVCVSVHLGQHLGLRVQFCNHIMLYSVKIHYKPLKPNENLQWDVAPKPELLECPSIRPSVVLPSVHFSFPDDNLRMNISGFSPNLVCALILWRSGLRLLMDKFLKF